MTAERLAYPDNDTLDRIVDAFCNRGGKGVQFRDIYEHDVCNHTLSGTIEVQGQAYGFIIENGNWNGTVVRKWGEPDDVGIYDPPPPSEPFTFIPTDLCLHLDRPEMFKLYAWWRKQSWFIKKERDYAYDRYFQPGGFVENHYRDWAAKKGLKIGLLSDLPQSARDML